MLLRNFYTKVRPMDQSRHEQKEEALCKCFENMEREKMAGYSHDLAKTQEVSAMLSQWKGGSL